MKQQQRNIIILSVVAVVLLVGSVVAAVISRRPSSSNQTNTKTSSSSSKSGDKGGANSNTVSYGGSKSDDGDKNGNQDGNQGGDSTGQSATGGSAGNGGNYSQATAGRGMAGLDASATNLPQAELNNIYSYLRVMLDTNGLSATPTDIQMRNGSYAQQLTDSDKMVYTTTFIIDIPSLQRSYTVTDWYSPLPEKVSGLTDYTAVIGCPSAEQRIYPSDTNCRAYTPGF